MPPLSDASRLACSALASGMISTFGSGRSNLTTM